MRVRDEEQSTGLTTTETGLEPLDQARAVIAKAIAERDTDTLIELRHRASAVELYQTRSGSREIANDAGEIKVRAERGLGQIDATERPRGRPKKIHPPGSFPGLNVHQDTRAAWRKLATKISPERFDEFIGWARADENSGVSTAQLIIYLRTGSQGSSVTFECYTPAIYIEAARTVLGEIDLDPASSTDANATVQAAQIFTEDDDGLEQDWHGRVFLNPPYGRSLTSQFVAKLVNEHAAGHVSAAILLINAYGFDAAWFQPLWDQTLCFTNHRIPFYGGGPTFGSLFVYFGTDGDLFAETFSQFGAVVVRR